MKVLVTGSAGFLAGYLVPELLDAGHDVVGIDNYSKYGEIARPHDGHPGYRFIRGDAKDAELLTTLCEGCDAIVAAAAMVGGIAFFKRFEYDILAENERIVASTFDAAIRSHARGDVRRVVVVSSSMVFESAASFPTREADVVSIPPPRSTYGLHKLAAERLAAAATRQHGIEYAIARLGNVVGLGDRGDPRGGLVSSGGLSLAMGHVIHDLVLKALKGQDPLHLFGDGRQTRRYTHAADVARGIRMCLESPAAANEDFNIASPVTTTVDELAGRIWRAVKGDVPLRIVHEPGFEYDVQRSEPDVTKARDVLGFEATRSLDAVIDEVVRWERAEIAAGRL